MSFLLLAAIQKNYEVAQDGRAKLWLCDGFEYINDTKSKQKTVYLRCRYFGHRKCAGRAKVVPDTDQLVVMRPHVCHWLGHIDVVDAAQ
jgi:hypothetical protein